MSAASARPVARLDAVALRAARRQPVTPFAVALEGDGEVVVEHLLRVLPGKRIVGEGEWQGRRVLVKLFIAPGSARHAAREQAGIAALQQAARFGVATPEILLAAPLPAGGHLVLTAFLENAQTLAQAWLALADLPIDSPIDSPADSPAGSAAASALLRPAFAAVGRLHAAGLIHDDVHLGNFLRSAGEVYIIDGDSVRAVSPGTALGERQAISNLALLFAQLSIDWDACRDDLLAAYHAGGAPTIADGERLAHEVARVRRCRLDDYLGKTVRECTLFAVEHTPLRFTAARRAEADALASLLRAPDVAIGAGVLLKDGGSATVARVEFAGRPLVVKRYNLKNLRHLCARFWRPTRAWHSWRAGHLLEFFGVATPAPLALVEERVGPLRRRGFLVSEHCPGVDLLHVLAPEREPDAELAQALLTLFRRLHALRISHGDLKATNLLWHRGRIVVIDLDSLTVHGSAASHARAWRRDRQRLLRNWPADCALHGWLDASLPPAR